MLRASKSLFLLSPHISLSASFHATLLIHLRNSADPIKTNLGHHLNVTGLAEPSLQDHSRGKQSWAPGIGGGRGQGRSRLRAWHWSCYDRWSGGVPPGPPTSVTELCIARTRGRSAPYSRHPASWAPHAGPPSCSHACWAPSDTGGWGRCHHTSRCPRGACPCLRRSSHAAADALLPWALNAGWAPQVRVLFLSPPRQRLHRGRVRPIPLARRVTLFFACCWQGTGGEVRRCGDPRGRKSR